MGRSKILFMRLVTSRSGLLCYFFAFFLVYDHVFTTTLWAILPFIAIVACEPFFATFEECLKMYTHDL